MQLTGRPCSHRGTCIGRERCPKVRAVLSCFQPHEHEVASQAKHIKASWGADYRRLLDSVDLVGGRAASR